jgi:hypothetical protein
LRFLVHADDTSYTVIKNGVVVVSGIGPAIRVDGNRLIIRDGPQEIPPLSLTRAGAGRKLRHIIVCGHASGFVIFDALRWLCDTGRDIARINKALAMRRSDLAVALGVGEIAVRKWERHSDKPLSPSTVGRIQPQLDELRARVSAAS